MFLLHSGGHQPPALNKCLYLPWEARLFSLGFPWGYGHLEVPVRLEDPFWDAAHTAFFYSGWRQHRKSYLQGGRVALGNEWSLEMALWSHVIPKLFSGGFFLVGRKMKLEAISISIFWFLPSYHLNLLVCPVSWMALYLSVLFKHHISICCKVTGPQIPTCQHASLCNIHF